MTNLQIFEILYLMINLFSFWIGGVIAYSAICNSRIRNRQMAAAPPFTRTIALPLIAPNSFMRLGKVKDVILFMVIPGTFFGYWLIRTIYILLNSNVINKILNTEMPWTK